MDCIHRDTDEMLKQHEKAVPKDGAAGQKLSRKFSEAEFNEELMATRTALANSLRTVAREKSREPLILLGCLNPQLMGVQAEGGPNLCTNIHGEYEKIEMMIDSGASETVAS